MLSKQLRGDARLGPVLDKITQQSFRAAEIANGLLNFSRTSTTEFRSTDLNQVIRDTLSLLEHQFKTAQIDVELDLSGELPPSMAIPESSSRSFSISCSTPRKPCRRRQPAHYHTCQRTRRSPYLRFRLRHRARASQRIYDPFFTTKTTPKPGDRRERASVFPSLMESFRNMPEKFMSRAPSAPALPFISSFRY